MSIGAPTGGAIWTEPARPSLGVTVTLPRWTRTDDGTLALTDTGAEAAAFTIQADGSITLVEGATTDTIVAVNVAGRIQFGGIPT